MAGHNWIALYESIASSREAKKSTIEIRYPEVDIRVVYTRDFQGRGQLLVRVYPREKPAG